MTSSSHIDYDLLAKYLAGEAGDGEVAKVQEWLEADPTHRNELEALRTATMLVPEDSASFDVDEAWDRWKGKNWKTNKPRARILSLKGRLMRIAAVLVLGLVAYAGYQYLQSKQGPVWTTALAVNTIRKVDLSDGTVVTLNRNAELTYSNEFGKSERRVSLKGEAFFDVKPNAGKPFVVEAGEAVIEVLGTQFNVSAPTKKTITVDVLEGKVRLFPQQAHGGAQEKVELIQGERGSYNAATGSITESKAAPDAFYWQSDVLRFDKTPLEEVFNILKDKYDIEISSVSKEILTCRLTATFKREQISNILSVIARTFDLEVEKTNQSYQISGEGCLPAMP